MKKNVIWWIGVKNDKYAEKYGGWEWVDISRKTWEYWCKKNDVLFVPFEKPIEEDLTKFRINWQKAIFVFDEMERRGIDYDQICQIDCTHMIKWDAPNFFELTNHELTAVRDTDNLRWIGDSIDGYEELFDFKLYRFKYVSSSPMIFNKKHREVFKSFKKLYYDNVDKFVELQDKTVHKGTEQTPLNYWLQKNNVKMNLTLPFSFKLTHMHRKELFGHNWQLNEDNMPFFIKYGYNWVFTGIPKDQRTQLMAQTWDLVKHNYDDKHFLNKVKDKVLDKDTTSRKFKEDLINTFGSVHKNDTLLELGCNRGHTTRVYASLFKKVIAVERSKNNIEVAKQVCGDVDNVEFICQDVYDNFKLPSVDVVHIDAGHSHDEVMFDIKRCLDELQKPILIFDDVCNKLYPNGEIGLSIRTAVDEFINSDKIRLNKYIGEDKGYKTGNGKVLLGREGMICSVM